MEHSLTQKTIQGIKWSYISTIATAVMQVGYTAVMSRLLNPADFGLVAMGGVVLRFGQYFAQMGMGSAVVQKKDLTQENISAAFTSSIFLGLIFSLLTIVLAPLGGYLFKNNDLIPVLRLMGLSFFISGFSLTSLALIRRSIEFKALAFSEIFAFGVGYLVIGIGSALSGQGMWSLVYASLSQSTILAGLTYLIRRHELKLSFHWADYKSLLSFGSKVSIISFLEFLGGSLDTFLIGRYFGNEKLGFYNRAQMLINLPLTYLITSFSRVLFPSLSQMQDDQEILKQRILFILKIISAVLFPFVALVSIFSRDIVTIILGDKWIASISLLSILAYASGVDFLEHIIAVLFEAKGLLIEKFALQSSYIIILGLFFYLACPFGVIGFGIALLFAQFIRFIGFSIILIKRINIPPFEYLKIYYPSFASMIILTMILVPINYLLNLLSINYGLLITVKIIAICILTMSVLSLKFNQEIKQTITEILRIMLKGEK